MKRLRGSTSVSGGDREAPRTECAIDENDPVLVAHFLSSAFGKARQQFLVMLGRSAASANEMRTARDEHIILFVEQPPDNLVHRQTGVEQFLVPDRSRHHCDVLPFGMVEADVQTLPPFLAVRKVLNQQACGPATIRSRGYRHADQSGHLFGLDEIALAGFGQTIAFERNDPLIAPLFARQIEGERQISGSEQGEKRRISPQFD